MTSNSDLLTIKEAQKTINKAFDLSITKNNINYLIQYGKIKAISYEGTKKISKKEVLIYYSSKYNNRKEEWQKKLGKDLIWELSFDKVKEKDRTEHVHRLHPYKGKFIPQLVKYFLDENTNSIKKNIYFKKGDIVLDPFCGSGTTLVVANELGLNGIGIDISEFNSLISNVKVHNHNLINLQREINKIISSLKIFYYESNRPGFENELQRRLSQFNKKYFPSPDYKYKVKHGIIDQIRYSKDKDLKFKNIFNKLTQKYNIKLKQSSNESFLAKWYLEPVREDINFVYRQLNKVKDKDIRNVLTIILSRTMRSCRATTHTNLATLISPVVSSYYCRKHYKICVPIFSILNWLTRYSYDTIKRLSQFNRIRTNTYQICLTDDSRTINIEGKLKTKQEDLYKLFKHKKIKGIFTSPPYVGLINYHEQHAYAYELFGFDRRDKSEIGPLFKGKSENAKDDYINGISKVLRNCLKYLEDDFNIFIVANDKYNLYPKIVKKAGLIIVSRFKRPVLHRTEKDKSAYCETIFHIKKCNKNE